MTLAIEPSRGPSIRRHFSLILLAIAGLGGVADAAALYRLTDYGPVDVDARDFKGIGLDGKGGVTFGPHDPPAGPYRVTSFIDTYHQFTQVSYRIDSSGNQLRIPIVAPVGDDGDTTNVSAVAVNRSGLVVGYSVGGRDNGYHARAFLFDPSKDHVYSERLPMPPGNGNSLAYAINDFGAIVGEYGDVSRMAHAFLWAGGTTWDLNTLIAPDTGLILTSAINIDDLGQIVGYGVDSKGRNHEYLLTPLTTPEPSLLLGGACLGVGSLVSRAFRRGIRKGSGTAG